MGAIEKNSFVWASLGIEPPSKEDAIYEAGEQPIAGFDNYVKWAITEDIDALNDFAGNHSSEHEAGGAQEINLSGLGIGGAGQLVGHNTTDATEVRIEQTGSTAAPVRIDMADDVIRAFPDFAVQPTFREGINLKQNLYRNGDVIYDYNDDYFHRAEHALQADIAEFADDSALLEGSPASAFIREEDATVNPTGVWDFQQAINANITGNAATADYAEAADYAASAGFADEAEDSQQLEGHTVAEILAMISDDIEESFPSVEDDGNQRISRATTLDFGQSIDVSTIGTTAEMSVDSVPHADEAEFATNSHKVDGYHASDLISMMSDGDGRWTHIGSFEDGGYNWWWEHTFDEQWDRIRLLIHHERADDGANQDQIALRLNGDTRQRYISFQDGYTGGNNDWDRESEMRHFFPAAPTYPESRTVCEYEITAPQVIDSSYDIDSYPEISLVSGGPHPYIHEVSDRGILETNYDNGVESIQLEPCNEWTSNVRIEIHARKIKPDL